MKIELVKEIRQICRGTYNMLNRRHIQLKKEGANVEVLNEIVADMKKVVKIYDEVNAVSEANAENEVNVEELKNNAISLRDAIEAKYFKQSKEETSTSTEDKKETKCEELKQILEGIKKSIEAYNNLNPKEKITISPQDQRKDVSNTFICVYNHNHIGLFEKKDWTSEHYYVWDDECYESGSVYVGVNSNYIGMKTTHDGCLSVDRWERPGARAAIENEDIFVANCYMLKGMSFDDMRLIMYSEGQIEPYEIGKANSQEMLDVLKYASSYYQLDQDIQRKRTK